MKWHTCETRKELLQAITGRRIYVFVKGNGGELWIRVTRKALLDALMEHGVYECNYQHAGSFKYMHYKTVFLNL